MEFTKNQKVAFFTEKTKPNSWQVGTFQTQNESGVCHILHNGKYVAVLKQDVRRFEPCDEEKIEQFGRDQIANLVHHLKEATKHFNLEKFIGEVKTDENVVLVMNGCITIQPSSTMRPCIGVVRGVPCWSISEWRQIHSFDRMSPPDVDEIPVGESSNNMCIVQKVIQEAIKCQLECYFESLSLADAFAENY